MPSKRSAAKLVSGVRQREAEVTWRETLVQRREIEVPEIKNFAKALAAEGARTCRMATRLAAYDLAENVEEQYASMVATAKIGARAMLLARHELCRVLTSCVCDLGST